MTDRKTWFITGAGRGMGLGICREIVESHGGSMELASEQGHGTTVRLSIPTGD